MLRNIPACISPDLMHALMSMGHADEIAILEKVFSEHEVGTVPQAYANALRQLHRTHRLGIVSDIWSHSEGFYQELARAGIRELLEVVVFSSDIGIIKPSPDLIISDLQDVLLV